MNDIIAVVSDFFAGLESRERLFLKIGALVLAILTVVMLLLPRFEVYFQLKGQADTLKADMSWLQEKRELVAGLANNCQTIRKQDVSLKTDLSSLVRRNQLEVVSSTEKDNVISLTVSGTKSNQFLKLMHQIACRGYIFDKVALTSEVDDLSKIKARFEVQRVN